MNAKQYNYLKVGLAIVLAIVFVGAVANSVMTINRASPPPPARRVATTTIQPAAQPTAVPRSATSSPTPIIAAVSIETPQAATGGVIWPNFTLDDIIGYDPFAIAKTADTTAVSREGVPGDAKQSTVGASDNSKGPATVSESSFAGRIHAVYQRGGKTAALVGSKTVKPGDDLEGAGRVVEVDQAGLMLEVKK
jgi:hypothetical protein